MAKKLWLQSLSFGIAGLLIGILIGRQFSSVPVQEESAGLKLYEGNAAATDIESPFAISLPEDLTREAQLTTLTNLVSRYDFCHLPIKVVDIKDNIATINLVEQPWNQEAATPTALPGCAGASWRTQYFQGSAGGLMTSKVLAHTLVQPDFEGDWIEGVQFQYQGTLINADEWDHLLLSGVITEDNLP